MSSRSERYLANAEKCQQVADAANTSGTKRLYGVMASQWRQLVDEADEADKKPLLEKIRQTHLLREIDKAHSPAPAAYLRSKPPCGLPADLGPAIMFNRQFGG